MKVKCDISIRVTRDKEEAQYMQGLLWYQMKPRFLEFPVLPHREIRGPSRSLTWPRK